MRELTYMDRGIDERLILDGEDLGSINRLSNRQLLGKLAELGLINLNVINFDDYEEHYKEYWGNVL